MKKLVFYISAILLLFALASCGEEQTPDVPPDTPPTEMRIESKTYAETFVRNGDEVAAYAVSVPYMTEGNADTVDEFNRCFSEIKDDIIKRFEETTIPAAEAKHDMLSDEWGERLYFMSLTYTENRSGDYYGVTLDKTESDGETSAFTDFYAVMFDLATGKPMDFDAFSDDREVFLKTMKASLIQLIEEQGMADGCFEDFRDRLGDLKNARICYTDEGAMVVFPNGEIGDNAYYLLVPYDMFSQIMSDYGKSLLQSFFTE